MSVNSPRTGDTGGETITAPDTGRHGDHGDGVFAGDPIRADAGWLLITVPRERPGGESVATDDDWWADAGWRMLSRFGLFALQQLGLFTALETSTPHRARIHHT